MRPPARSVRILTTWVDQHARRIGKAPSRVRNWVSFMVLGGALQRAGIAGTGPRFVIGGGVALELRLGSSGRATRDLDVLLAGHFVPIEALSEALREPYQGFTFRVRKDAHEMPNGALRTAVQMDYLGRPWATVQLDIGGTELSDSRVELVRAIDLSHLGIEGPTSLPCLPLPQHVAQKIHAVTRPPTDAWPNDRFRDLIDILMLRDWVIDRAVLQPACQEVFRLRKTHSWPPLFLPREEWAAPFARMAEEVGLPIPDLHQAAIKLREFVHEIDASAPPWPSLEWPPGLSTTTWYYAARSDDSVAALPFKVGDDLIRDRTTAIPRLRPEWVLDTGGVALLGVVVLRQDGRPRFIERVGTHPVAVTSGAGGLAVAYGPAVWQSLAEAVTRRSRAKVRAMRALSVFLSTQHGFLPAVVGAQSGDSTGWVHRAWSTLNQGRSARIVWDLEQSTHVEFRPSADDPVE